MIPLVAQRDRSFPQSITELQPLTVKDRKGKRFKLLRKYSQPHNGTWALPLSLFQKRPKHS